MADRKETAERWREGVKAALDGLLGFLIYQGLNTLGLALVMSWVLRSPLNYLDQPVSDWECLVIALVFFVPFHFGWIVPQDRKEQAEAAARYKALVLLRMSLGENGFAAVLRAPPSEDAGEYEAPAHLDWRERDKVLQDINYEAWKIGAERAGE